MQQQLISLNPDLAKLWEEGYCLEISGSYLLAHKIPYVTLQKEIKYGSLVCILTLAGPSKVGRPQDHTIYFCGELPCNSEGLPLNAIINNSQTMNLTQTIVVNHYFSSKPLCGNYKDYYEKIRTYSEILSSQARFIDQSVTAKSNKIKENG